MRQGKESTDIQMAFSLSHFLLGPKPQPPLIHGIIYIQDRTYFLTNLPQAYLKVYLNSSLGISKSNRVDDKDDLKSTLVDLAPKPVTLHHNILPLAP